MEAVYRHMRAFTAKLVKNPARARALLKEIGAVAPESEGGVEPTA
jgi:hypothetical protein